MHAYWNDWYFGWGWFLWLDFVILMFSSIGNWGYTYRAHRRIGAEPDRFDSRDHRRRSQQAFRPRLRTARLHQR